MSMHAKCMQKCANHCIILCVSAGTVYIYIYRPLQQPEIVVMFGQMTCYPGNAGLSESHKTPESDLKLSQLRFCPKSSFV